MKRGITGKIAYWVLHLIGFFLLYLVLRNFNRSLFGNFFNAFRPMDFISGLSLLVLVYIFKSFRWMLINRTFGIRLSYGTTLVYFLVSGFLSVITPGRLGEFAKIFFLQRKTGTSAATATSSVVLDRVWDVLILSLLGGIGAIMVFGGFSLNLLTIALIAAFFLLSLAIILFPSLVFIPVKFIFRKKKQFKDDLDKVHDDWRSNAARLFLPGFLITLLAFFALALIPLFFSGRIGQEIGLLPSVSAVSISNMLAFLPVTVGGFGTRELVFSEIWKVLGYTAESAITISTAYFICNYLGSLVLGGLTYLVWFKKHFRLKELREKAS